MPWDPGRGVVINECAHAGHKVGQGVFPCVDRLKNATDSPTLYTFVRNTLAVACSCHPQEPILRTTRHRRHHHQRAPNSDERTRSRSRPLNQVLTETKRAVIRARNDEIERREREAKKKIVRMEDQEEMLAAAESIPVPLGQQQPPQHQELQEGGRRPGVEEAGSSHGEQRRRRRDPLTAWVCGCYHSDDYAGHVSDLRQFLRGIDFQHVSFGFGSRFLQASRKMR